MMNKNLDTHGYKPRPLNIGAESTLEQELDSCLDDLKAKFKAWAAAEADDLDDIEMEMDYIVLELQDVLEEIEDPGEQSEPIDINHISTVIR